MRIAHFSDLHLLSLDAIPGRRLLNKRITGWLNLRMKRAGIHRDGYVRAIARQVARLEVDHVVVTGDLTNLALEGEYERARELLDRDLGLDASRVTVVPGNHDLYTQGALGARRFEAYLGRYLESELPELAVDVGGGRFPVVKLRGEIAIVGLSSAVPRPPFVAAGELGEAQLAALSRTLAHPEVARRVPVVALHHPAVEDRTGLRAYVQGLRDASALVEQLGPLATGLLLHGHLHRRVQRNLAGRTGVLQVSATSASLHHDDPDRMAGFNLYTLEPGAAPRVEAHVYSPGDDTFHVESVPKRV